MKRGNHALDRARRDAEVLGEVLAGSVAPPGSARERGDNVEEEALVN